MAERWVDRYEVPVDDRWHQYELHSRPLHVACRVRHTVEFWALHVDERVATPWMLKAIGTGQRLPESAVYVATALSPDGLVWHLVTDGAFAHLLGDDKGVGVSTGG